MKKTEVPITDLKDHPFFKQVLEFNGQKAFYDFVDLFNKKETITNKDIDTSIVFNVLDLMIEDETKAFHKTISIGTELYRCRKINQDKEIVAGNIDANYTKGNGFYTCGYDESNSKEGPHSKTEAARINYEGIPYIYLAEELCFPD